MGQQQAGFRSRIIEEFQAKKGLLVLGRSHSNSLTRAGAMNDPAETARFSSLDRHMRPGRRDESHYDNPRSLMLSVGVWGDRGDQPRDQQLSPPQASKQSSSGQQQHQQLQQLQQPKQIEIRYKNGNTAELMEDPRKFV